MKKSSNMIKVKIVSLVVFALLAVVIMYGTNNYSSRKVQKDIFFPSLKDSMLESSKLTLKTLVQTQIASINYEIQGITERDKKIEKIIEQTDIQRFFDDKSGYFFAYDIDCIRINHPVNKSKNGESFKHLQDKKGNYLIQDLAQAARSGGGFVTYFFEKPGKGIQPKLSYSELVPGTDIFIGCGVYIDNIDESVGLLTNEIQNEQKIYTRINILLFIIIVSLLITFGLRIALKISGVITRSVVELHKGATIVTESSGAVSTSSQELASGSSEQASSLEEISASLEELSSMTQQNADNAKQANVLAKEADNTAQTGADSMHKMNSAIAEIQKSSDETHKIIKDIDEIAFQTNLLALNAAVEAARAGEAGKGFAVVAEEVRNLAMRSAEAAKNTSEMIEMSVKNAKNGGDIVKEVDDSLQKILDVIGKVNAIVAEIDVASKEQAEGLGQVNTAMGQIDSVTQRNAANAEESAAASEELSSQAVNLEKVVKDLAGLVGGSGGAMVTTNHSNMSYSSDSSLKRPPVKPAIASPVHANPPVRQNITKKPDVINPQQVIPLDDDEF